MIRKDVTETGCLRNLLSILVECEPHSHPIYTHLSLNLAVILVYSTLHARTQQVH